MELDPESREKFKNLQEQVMNIYMELVNVKDYDHQMLKQTFEEEKNRKFNFHSICLSEIAINRLFSFFKSSVTEFQESTQTINVLIADIEYILKQKTSQKDLIFREPSEDRYVMFYKVVDKHEKIDQIELDLL